MKAYVLQSAQDRTIDDLQVVDMPQPQPGRGEVVIEVKAVGLNPVDYKLIASGNAAWEYPHILGCDVAGVIVALGEGVDDHWKIGMRVAGHGDLRRNGSFAQYVAAPVYELALIPENVEFTTAAGMLCSAMTAYQAINRKANLNLVRTALIHGGSGAVGGIALQLAKMHGVRVFTTCSTAKIPAVQDLEPDEIIDYQTENVDARIQELTDGLGVDLIVDTVSAEESARDLNRLAYNGQLITIVGTPDVDPSVMFAHAFSIDMVNLGGAHGSGNPVQQEDLGTIASDILQMVSLGRLNPMIDTVLSFDELPEGLRLLSTHQITGKAVVKL